MGFFALKMEMTGRETACHSGRSDQHGLLCGRARGRRSESDGSSLTQDSWSEVKSLKPEEEAGIRAVSRWCIISVGSEVRGLRSEADRAS